MLQESCLEQPNGLLVFNAADGGPKPASNADGTMFIMASTRKTK